MQEAQFIPHATTAVRVRYAETDGMGVVYHANYLVWFEVGRVELMRSMGLEYRRLEQDHDCLIAVVEANLRYRAPARYDDALTVKTRIAGVRGAVLKMAYQVCRDADGRLLCEGTTTHMVVSRAMTRRELPEEYAAAFQRMLHGRAAADLETADV